jgi:hypothetical protein
MHAPLAFSTACRSERHCAVEDVRGGCALGTSRLMMKREERAMKISTGTSGPTPRKRR